MQKMISYYDVAWDRRNHKGALRVTFDDRTNANLRDLSMQELSLLCNLLRAEKPVYYDDQAESFTTDREYPSSAD